MEIRHRAFFLVVVTGAFFSRPLRFAALLVLKAGITGALVGHGNPWLFYSVFLIFIGGIIILMLYVTSLRENDKEKVRGTNSLKVIIGVRAVSWAMAYSLERGSPQSLISNLFIGAQAGLLSFLTLYLILVLFLSVKVSQREAGALSKYN